MSDWTSTEAKEFLSIIRGEAEKVVKDYGDRQSSVYSCLAVVTAIPVSGDISVRLLSSPADGSQDFVVRNRSGSTLEVGDSVWLHYWSDYTNVYIAMRNAGDGESNLMPEDIGAQPNDAVSSNLIINGGFDVWQRGTSFSAAGYTADRWNLQFNGTGATRAITRQAFTAGQTGVPNNPAYYLRFAQSVAGSGGTYNFITQRIEDVSRLSGKTIAISFYAKADSARDIKTLFDQNFGSGGSSTVYVGEVTHSLTTAWQRFTRTVTLPSVSGKTIGASNFSSIYFLMPINTTFTIDIANVQLNYGSVALPFVPRAFGDELRMCQRYFEKSYDYPVAPGSTGAGVGLWFVNVLAAETAANARWPVGAHPRFAVLKRTAPTVTLYEYGGTVGSWSIGGAVRATASGPSKNGFTIMNNTGGSVTPTAGETYGHWVADAEL